MDQMNDKREVAIQISDVKKQYRLGQIGGGTLQADLQSWWARIRGKDDPNIKIDQEQRLEGQTFMALNGINLTVYQGEALGIIGENGAGKSTLLKLLTRVTAPTDGVIDIYGRVASMLEVGTGFNGEMTGRENIYMNGAILGMTKAEIDAKMEDIIEFSEVREFIDTPVKRYSSGMYVKLAFSVAAHLDSEIMIMDEVLAVGDVSFQKKCLNKMRMAAKEEGRTILYVSHNMNTIRQLCDRCIVMNQGKVIFEGEVEKAIDIYVGTNGVSPTVVDLTKGERKQKTIDGLKLTSIRILDHDRWYINFGEKLKFEITAKAEKSFANVNYRSRVFTFEGDSVTSLRAPNIFSCEAGDEIKVQLEADTSTLVPGQYCLSPVLYASNEYGGSQFYDHIENGVVFEVLSILEFNNGLPWSHRWSGYFKMPDMIVIKKKDKE